MDLPLTYGATEVSYELMQDDMIVAGAEGKGALKEILHYAAMYGRDGPVTLYEVTRREINIEEPT